MLKVTRENTLRSSGSKFVSLTFSALKTKTISCKQCRSWWDGSLWVVSSGSTLFAFYFDFLLKPLFGTMVLIRFKGGKDHFKNPAMKGLTNSLCQLWHLIYNKIKCIDRAYFMRVRAVLSLSKPNIAYNILTNCIRPHGGLQWSVRSTVTLPQIQVNWNWIRFCGFVFFYLQNLTRWQRLIKTNDDLWIDEMRR